MLYMSYTAHQLDIPCLSLKLLGYARNIDPLTQPPGKRSYSMLYNQGRRHSETRPQAPGTFSLRDRSLITGRGWLQNGKNMGIQLFTFPSPPQNRVTLSALPLLKSGNFFRPHSKEVTTCSMTKDVVIVRHAHKPRAPIVLGTGH